MAGLSPEGIAAAQAAVARMERGEFDDEALAVAVAATGDEEAQARDDAEADEASYAAWLEQAEVDHEALIEADYALSPTAYRQRYVLGLDTQEQAGTWF